MIDSNLISVLWSHKEKRPPVGRFEPVTTVLWPPNSPKSTNLTAIPFMIISNSIYYTSS